MGMNDANSHATVWLPGRTTGIQNNGFSQSDSHFMCLNRSKYPPGGDHMSATVVAGHRARRCRTALSPPAGEKAVGRKRRNKP